MSQSTVTKNEQELFLIRKKLIIKGDCNMKEASMFLNVNYGEGRKIFKKIKSEVVLSGFENNKNVILTERLLDYTGFNKKDYL